MTIMATNGKVMIEHEDSDTDDQIETQESNVSDDESNDDAKEDGQEDTVEENNINEDDEKSSDEEEEDYVDTDSDKESDCEDDSNNKSKCNSGWADSIAKILKANKPKGKKTLVLSKAKKLTDVKQKPKPVGFEIATADGEIKDEKLDPEELEDNTEEPPPKKKRELPNVRVKPNILNKDRERTLSKIATKGVVQLFNAVRIQQKDIDTKLKEAGPLEVKRDKVLKNIDKRTFLNTLMGERGQPAENISSTDVKNKETVTKTNAKDKVTWNVLRDDFMMGAKMKDWDKELEEQEEEIEMETEEIECE